MASPNKKRDDRCRLLARFLLLASRLSPTVLAMTPAVVLSCCLEVPIATRSAILYYLAGASSSLRAMLVSWRAFFKRMTFVLVDGALLLLPHAVRGPAFLVPFIKARAHAGPRVEQAPLLRMARCTPQQQGCTRANYATVEVGGCGRRRSIPPCSSAARKRLAHRRHPVSRLAKQSLHLPTRCPSSAPAAIPAPRAAQAPTNSSSPRM